jgi:hypothetical protein
MCRPNRFIEREHRDVIGPGHLHVLEDEHKRTSESATALLLAIRMVGALGPAKASATWPANPASSASHWTTVAAIALAAFAASRKPLMRRCTMGSGVAHEI